VCPQRFRRHFSCTLLERGGAEGNLAGLNGRASLQMLTWHGARARRSYDRIMETGRDRDPNREAAHTTAERTVDGDRPHGL
jgi:hypothetical protein